MAKLNDIQSGFLCEMCIRQKTENVYYTYEMNRYTHREKQNGNSPALPGESAYPAVRTDRR